MKFRRYAVRSLFKQKQMRSQIVLLTLIACLLSFSLVFVNSMTEGISKTFATLSGGTIRLKGHYPDKGDCVVDTDALIYGTDEISALALKGVETGYFNDSRIACFESFEQIESDSALNHLIISKRCADRLSLGLGDKTVLVLHTGTNFRPVMSVITGVYESGYRELDEVLAFCSMDKVEGTAHTEILSFENPQQQLSLLRSEGYEALGWWQTHADIAGNLVTSSRVILFVFITVAILCAYFVSEFSATLVVDKRREIALFRLLGASRGELLQALTLCSFLVSFLSLVAGMVAGILLAEAFVPLLGFLSSLDIPAFSFYLLRFEILVPWRTLALLLLLLLGCSVLVSRIGFRRIDRIEPVLLAR